MKFVNKVLLVLVLVTLAMEVASVERFISHLSKNKDKNNLIKRFLRRKTLAQVEKSGADVGDIDPDQNEDAKALLNQVVLTDIQTIAIYSAMTDALYNKSLCSYGFVPITDTLQLPIAINKKAGSLNYYLCAKYKRYVDTTAADKLVSYIEVSKTSSKSRRCGSSLRGAFENLNKSSTNNAPYICYGEKKFTSDADYNKNIPIKNLILKKVPKNKYKDEDYKFKIGVDSYECLFNNLNVVGTEKVILCFTRQMQGIKSIEYKNIGVAAGGQITQSAGNQNYLSDEFRIDNGDAADDLTITIERSKSQADGTSTTTTNSGGFGIDASISVSFWKIVTVTLSVETTFNWSSSSVQSSTSTSTNANKMECTAKAGKFYKCQQNISENKMNFPVAFTKVFKTYDGRTVEATGKSSTGEIKTTNVTTKSCCYSKCSAEDVLCAGAKIENTNICEASPNVAQTIQKNATTKKIETIVGAKNVVTDIKLLFDKTTSANCPAGYDKISTKLKSAYDSYNVYLCVKKQALSTITEANKVINTIRFQLGNGDCGSLRQAESTGTHDNNISLYGSSNNPIYMCFGLDTNIKTAEVHPIINIELVSTKGTNDESAAEPIHYYNTTDFSIYSGQGLSIFKITRQKNTPKEIEVTDYNITSFTRDPLELPESVDTIKAASSTVTRTFSNSVTTETAKSFAFEIGASVKVTVNIKGGVAEGSIGISGNYSYSQETTNTNTVTNTDSQEIPCKAVPGKVVKCYIQKNKSSITQNYTYKQTYKGYAGNVIKTETVQGSGASTETKSLSITTCCEDGCCEGDATKDKGKEQCFDDNGDVKPKDVKCSEYDTCLANAKNVFKTKTPTTKTLSVTTR